MTKKDLLKRLEEFDDNTMIVISDGKSWANIDKVVKNGSIIELEIEKFPVFSEN